MQFACKKNQRNYNCNEIGMYDYALPYLKDSKGEEKYFYSKFTYIYFILTVKTTYYNNIAIRVTFSIYTWR